MQAWHQQMSSKEDRDFSDLALSNLAFAEAYKVLNDYHSAEDIAQDIWVKRLEGEITGYSLDLPERWFCKCARNDAINLGRKERRRQDTSKIESSESQYSPSEYEERDPLECVYLMSDFLPKKLHESFGAWWAVNSAERGKREVARQMDRPEATLREQFKDITNQLRMSVKGYADDLSTMLRTYKHHINLREDSVTPDTPCTVLDVSLLKKGAASFGLHGFSSGIIKAGESMIQKYKTKFVGRVPDPFTRIILLPEKSLTRQLIDDFESAVVRLHACGYTVYCLQASAEKNQDFVADVGLIGDVAYDYGVGITNCGTAHCFLDRRSSHSDFVKVRERVFDALRAAKKIREGEVKEFCDALRNKCITPWRSFI
jgi:DNA-directed RNA polymerase specialized sigma24 family protein